MGRGGGGHLHPATCPHSGAGPPLEVFRRRARCVILRPPARGPRPLGAAALARGQLMARLCKQRLAQVQEPLSVLRLP